MTPTKRNRVRQNAVGLALGVCVALLVCAGCATGPKGITSFEEARAIENRLYRLGAVLPIDSCPVKVIKAQTFNPPMLGSSFRYSLYNSGDKTVYAVRFLAKFWDDFDESVLPGDYAVIEAKNLNLKPGHEIDASWNISAPAYDFGMVVMRVTFDDQSEWRPTEEEDAKIRRFENAQVGHWR